ncbi:hypothetical protein DL768_000646 [Monosporascus sp. mg162]|nr:hypothetical protein DL768_000646 [Monosporascus sp. mg162]
MIAPKHFFLSLVVLQPIARALIQSISAIDGYSQQRPCATSCFYNDVGDDILGSNMRCCEAYGTPTCKGGVADQCYCRPDLRPSAVSWLSLCVETRCSSNTVDFTSAVAVYDDYCSSVDVVAGPVATEPPSTITTEGSLPPTGSPAATIVTQTATSSSGIPTRMSGKALLAISILFFLF